MFSSEDSLTYIKAVLFLVMNSCFVIVSTSRSPPGLCSDNVVAVPFHNGASAGIYFYEFDIPFGITCGDFG